MHGAGLGKVWEVMVAVKAHARPVIGQFVVNPTAYPPLKCDCNLISVIVGRKSSRQLRPRKCKPVKSARILVSRECPISGSEQYKLRRTQGSGSIEQAEFLVPENNRRQIALIGHSDSDMANE